jgi:hypothetical protein
MKSPAELFAEAQAAGLAAGLAIKPPSYVLRQVNPITGAAMPAAQSYQMQGSCGFAWIVVKPANSKFAKWLVAQGVGRKAYGGGIRVSIQDHGQCMERKAEHARAMWKVLEAAGIKGHWDQRID